MTEEQLLAAFPGSTRLVGDAALPYTKFGFAPISVPEVKIAGTLFKPHFRFDPVSGLRQVLLSPESDVTEIDFQSLEGALVEKYGAPWKTKSASATSNSQHSQWSFPSTTIVVELTVIHLDDSVPSVFILTLSYKRHLDSPL